MRATFTALATVLALTACGQNAPAPAPSDTLAAKVEYSADAIKAETDRLNAWFEVKYEENLAFSPIQQTFLGRDTNQDKIDDFSTEAQDTQLAWRRHTMQDLLANFDYDKLTAEAKTSYDIWAYQSKAAEAADKFRTNGYVFEQMGAIQSFFPQLLIAFQKVEDGKGMDNYLARIAGSARALDQLVDRSKTNAKTGVHPPYFAFKQVIAESQKIITGAPFDNSGHDSAIWKDAKSKIAKLLKDKKIDQAKADQLTSDIRTSLLENWKPAYERLIAWQKQDQVNATPEAHGVGSLPNGLAYYNERLANQTTTTLTADEIHQIGLSEVARLRGEMIAVKDKFGFEGSLPEFFKFLRETKDDERLYSVFW
ncbi:MAG: hypothetical protein COA85_05145 [Robiginitomaculum sp.]|nr:MAG: hypothetical protein COA85_05145 [Robiginitomaculum sp.]